MTIVKHGKYFGKPVIFKCQCGCEFVAERKEYSIMYECYTLPNSETVSSTAYARTTCPECEKFIKVEVNN